MTTIMKHTMKAIVNEKFGSPDVFQMKEIAKPDIEEDEVLIKTYSTSVNTIDIVFRNGKKYIFGLVRLVTGILRPRKKILGFDIAGEVVKIGKGVTEFEIGDQVYGRSESGANAEFSNSKKSKIAKKPKSMTYSEAAVVPMGALSSLQGLRDSANIQIGQTVLIYGASGGLGIYAIQLAKNYGAIVTGVASGKNEKLVLSLGADKFIDYTKDDFSDKLGTYDIVYDTVGKFPMSLWKKCLVENGVFVTAGSPKMSLTGFVLRQIGNKFRKKKFTSFDTIYNTEDLNIIAKLSEEGKIKSIIDKAYTLEEMSEAHFYYEKGHTAGKIVVNIQNEIEN